jgi:hypothetical protein
MGVDIYANIHTEKSEKKDTKEWKKSNFHHKK